MAHDVNQLVLPLCFWCALSFFAIFQGIGCGCLQALPDQRLLQQQQQQRVLQWKPMAAAHHMMLYEDLLKGPVLGPLSPPAGPLPISGHFSTVLQSALARLDQGDTGVLQHFAHVAEDFVTLYDGFPKSRFHLLVMPRQRIATVRDLRAEHLPLLRQLSAYTAWILENLASQHPDCTWRHGVHAEPSILQLHIHVLSQDFRSPRLKHKKHFNSFQHPFLVPLDSVLEDVEADGCALRDVTKAVAEQWLKQDLRCSGCHAEFGSRFANLARHLATCGPPPSALPPQRWRSSVGIGELANAAEPQTAEPPPQQAEGEEAKTQKRAREEVVDLTDA